MTTHMVLFLRDDGHCDAVDCGSYEEAKGFAKGIGHAASPEIVAKVQQYECGYCGHKQTIVADPRGWVRCISCGGF